MKESKNIERLFQEKFKDFEAIPPLDSWDNIESRLNQKKKKRRVIPFWFKPVGIAASLILGFFLFVNKGNDSSLINDDSNFLNDNPISNVEKTSDEKTNTSTNQKNTIKNKILLEDEGLFNNNFVLEDDNSDQNKEAIQNKYRTVNNRVVLNKEQNTINKSSIKNNEVFNNQLNTSLDNKNQQNLTNNKNEKSSKDLSNRGINNEQLFVSPNTNNSIVDTQNFATNGKAQNKLNTNNNEELFVNQTSNPISKNQVVLNNNEEKNILIDKSKIELLNSSNNLNNEVVVSENSSSFEKTDSLLITNENIIANAIEDSILLASVETEENPLEKLLREKLEGKNVDEKEKEKRNKWAVSTVASPVYFNSVSQGSSLDSKLESNSKDYGNSLSFGLGLEYELSKKWSVKAGVNTLSLDYDTNDVVFFQDVNARTMENVTPSQTGSMLSVQSKRLSQSNTINMSGTVVEKFEGEINQKMGYIEVPLELSYKLLDKKFGINVIGGMSTLFLNENRVSLVSNGSEINIGEANNLNNIHFSSNVGLGFKYTFWKSFQANFQPMFKYQINTFSNDSGNFKPYFVGLYSGISFSF
ncbi:MAG: hypothetical protein ABNG98_02385 [Flavobacterium sp.]|jgi:hypothetical protein